MEKKTNKPVKARLYKVNELVAPKELEAFKKWHSQCCKRDPLSAEERFKQLFKIEDAIVVKDSVKDPAKK